MRQFYTKKPRPISLRIRRARERLIPLSDLKPEDKRRLWKALKERAPAQAQLFTDMQTDPFVLALQSRFGAVLVMEEDTINQYLGRDK